MRYLICLAFGLFLITPLLNAQAADGLKAGFVEDFPENPDIEKNYLIYLHGAIIERGDLSPTHPRFGVYDMPAIRAALGEVDNTILISAQRQAGTIPALYAQMLSNNIEGLLAAGVPPQNITISGFSKGGAISILTSAARQNPNLNFVFMASCNSWAFDNEEIIVAGRILSIFEATDNIGVSCQPLIDKSTNVYEFEQIELNTGLRHGAFYQPYPSWVEPLKAWLGK